MGKISIAQGQFTITDYNDAITLSGYLASNTVKNQRYQIESETFIPSWEKSPVVITPNLFKAGSSQLLLPGSETNGVYKTDVTSITWYENGNKITNFTGDIFGSTRIKVGADKYLDYELIIKKNILLSEGYDHGLDIRCDIVYTDPTTKLDINHSLSISYTITKDGRGTVSLSLTTPYGESFANNQIESLMVQAELLKGGKKDETNVQYYWAYQDETVSSGSSPGYLDKFGIGWHYMTESNGNGNFTVSENKVTIYPSLVPGVLPIQCIAEDRDENPYKLYEDGVTLLDRSDPIEVIIVSRGGNVFKNGAGTDITLTARVYQGGVWINAPDSGIDPNCFQYSWSKFDQDGDLEESELSIDVSIDVSPSMVQTKATFWCDVTYTPQNPTSNS